MYTSREATSPNDWSTIRRIEAGTWRRTIICVYLPRAKLDWHHTLHFFETANFPPLPFRAGERAKTRLTRAALVAPHMSGSSPFRVWASGRSLILLEPRLEIVVASNKQQKELQAGRHEAVCSRIFLFGGPIQRLVLAVLKPHRSCSDG